MDSIINLFKKCWNRFLECVTWTCDPEGPSRSEVICKLVLRWIGIIFMITGIFFWILSYPSVFSLVKSNFGDSINIFRYIASALVFFGSGFHFVAKHSKRVELKTAVFNEEIDSLISEVKRSGKGSTLIKEIDDEAKVLEYFKRKPSEVSQLRLIALRKLHVETIKDFKELKAHAESDISEYRHYTSWDDDNYRTYRNAFNKLYSEWNWKRDRKATKSEFSVRLKELRKDLSWEKYWSGQGEAILESITHWSIPAIISLVIMGITPVLNQPIFIDPLGVINWGLLGMAGAILFTTVKMSKKDYSRIGEEEGNYVLRKMLLGMVIGMISAILLYVAIMSGLFGGKALPTFSEPLTDANKLRVFNSLSIFWAIAAGYSAKLVDGMFGAAEKGTTS